MTKKWFNWVMVACFFPLALTAMESKEALQRLMSGNERYVNDQATCINGAGHVEIEKAMIHQPFAAVLGCSDARVPLEVIFDQHVGDLFVVRVAGNVAGPVELDSLEFAVTTFEVPLILVVGHAHCGAVKAVVEGKAGEIPAVAALIEPGVKGQKELVAAIQANVKATVEMLKAAPVMKPVVESKKLEVVGAYYDLETGRVILLP